MKKIIVLLLLPFLGFTQNDTIKDVKSKLSVIGLDRMNVVYRGVPNPISIAVNNAKSYKISGNGVSQNEDGKYVLRPGPGTETKVIVEIEKLDGSKVIEEHIFRIKGLPKGLGTINGENCEHCIIEMSKNELLDAKISAIIPDFIFDYKPIVYQFNVNFLDKSPTIIVSGNTFNEEVKNKIKKSKKGTYFFISNIKKNYGCDNCNEFAKSIKVLISE